MPKLGFKIDARPAEDVPPLARSVERAGFDEFWVCEDLASGTVCLIGSPRSATIRRA
jgi:alkanesulfonate monooxygenase SsuD/methylene tetrahydromethanopterin reductase-like flavin-dependent oxidoreductase (luciferase family)